MKTSLIASIGLLLGAAFTLTATGCKITHYGTSESPVTPTGEVRCQATCERLVDERAIPRSALKTCKSACLSPVVASAPPPADARVAAKVPEPEAAEATCPAAVEVAASRRRDEPSPPPRRHDDGCPCKKGHDCAPCRSEAPAAPPPPECREDTDCPDDLLCEDGACR